VAAAAYFAIKEEEAASTLPCHVASPPPSVRSEEGEVADQYIPMRGRSEGERSHERETGAGRRRWRT
jgi:hypothetical protein